MFDFRVWEIDTDALDKLASSEFKKPNSDTATIVHYGSDLAPGSTVTVRLESGTVKEDLAVDALTYHLSSENCSTTVHVGPRLASNPPVLEAAARETALVTHNPTAASLSLGGS